MGVSILYLFILLLNFRLTLTLFNGDEYLREAFNSEITLAKSIILEDGVWIHSVVKHTLVIFSIVPFSIALGPALVT